MLHITVPHLFCLCVSLLQTAALAAIVASARKSGHIVMYLPDGDRLEPTLKGEYSKCSISQKEKYRNNFRTKESIKN